MTTQPTGVDHHKEVTRIMRTFNTDLARFNTAGYGTLRGQGVGTLRPGEVVSVTDDEADTYEAEVIAVEDETAQIQVHWDRVLHKA
jgi:hypothetical protein